MPTAPPNQPQPGAVPPPPDAAARATREKIAQQVPKPTEPLKPASLNGFQAALGEAVGMLTQGKRGVDTLPPERDGSMPYATFEAAFVLENFIRSAMGELQELSEYAEFSATEAASSNQGLDEGASMLQAFAADSAVEKAIRAMEAKIGGPPPEDDDAAELAAELTPKKRRT